MKIFKNIRIIFLKEQRERIYIHINREHNEE